MATGLPSRSGPRATSADAGRLAIAVAAPLAGAALAYALWWISDRLVVIGPVDRATFGWLVVVPVWALTPTLAAYVWRPLSPREAAIAGGVVGVVITAVATWLFWLAVSHPDCQFGAVRTPAEYIGPSVLFGLVVGGGFAATCLAASTTLRRGRWWSALLVGFASGLALVFLAILAATPVIMSGGCQRPG